MQVDKNVGGEGIGRMARSPQGGWAEDQPRNRRSGLDVPLTLDPYGVYPELPEELQQVGREYFARSPGSDIWVWFGDLPEATETVLWEKHKRTLAFPAGLQKSVV